MNESLENEILKEFKPYKVEELTKESILNDTVMDYLIALPNSTDKTREIESLRSKAQQLRVLRAFNSVFKQKNQDYIRDLKAKGGNTTNFTDSPFEKLKCGQWIADDTGVYKLDYTSTMQPIKIKASPIPVTVIERLVNIDTNIEKVKLAIFKDKKWQEIIAEKNTIVSKAKILQLANRGLEVTEDNAKNLITYLADLLELNNITVHTSVSHLGWVNEEFVPYTDGYSLDIDFEFKQKLDIIRSHGNYEEWKKYIKNLRTKSKTLRFVLACSFASALVKIFNINTFIVHLWGRSGNGKTVAEMICASIWGRPDNNFISNLSNTTIANERLCNFYRNLPIFLDELQIAKTKYKNFDELIYLLTEGKGKERGTTDNGIREQTTWQNIILLSGEEPITSEASKEGVKNRVIEINENETIVEDGNAVVNFIQENYGFAGKDFIEKIQDIDKIRGIQQNFVTELNKKIKYKKQVNAFSLILTADFIASSLIFKDKPLQLDEIQDYIREDTDETTRVYNLILDWFYENINKFNNSSGIGEVWGKYEKNGEEITSIYVISKVLKDFLASNNINFNGVKEKLLEKDYIETRNSIKEFTIPTKINGNNVRCIKINLPTEKSDLQFENEYTEQLTLENLPF